MLKIFRTRSLVLLAACALVVVGCGKSREQQEADSPLTDTSSLLRYVPADTPYLLGTLAPPPDDFLDKIEPTLDRVLAAYSTMLGAAVSDGLAESEADSEEAETINAVVDELRSLMSLDGLRAAGLTRDSTYILYGNGLLPVARVTLSDGSLFDDAITRIEAEAGEQLPVAQIKGMPYRYIEGEGVRVIIATAGDELVLTVAPGSLDDKSLGRLLGLELPARNIAQTGTLLELAKEYGYMHQYVGFVDTMRLADTFIEEPAELDALLLDMAGYDAGALSDACKTEFRALAAIAPRVVTGYEEVSTERVRSTAVVELRDDIASDFTAFVSPVPGLGKSHDGLFSFGMSLNLKAIRAFFDSRVAALRESPWTCEHLADLQDGLFAAQEQAQAQPVPPVVYDFRGFLAVVEELEGFDFGKKQPPESIDASFMLAIDNAQGLLALGQAMVPQLAEMTIEPNGKAHQFDVPDTGSGVTEAWLALTESAIALSVSEDAEAALPAMLGAESAVPPLFMSIGVDGAQYYALLGDAMRESDDEEMSEEMKAAVSDLLEAVADLYERVNVDVSFTERGIEIDSDVALAD